MINETLEKLKLYEDHEFKFNPKKHKYTYKGKELISVTRFIERFHKEFNNEFWSKKKAEETGVSQTQIQSEWKQINDRSNIVGTATHNWIENYFNKIYQELPNDLDIINRINKFNVIYAKHLYKLSPVKFEVRIFSKKFDIAGMIDSLFVYNGDIIIIDYKTNKKFTTDEHPKGRYEKLLYPFDDYYKNHLNEYSIQQSLYSLILKEIGINVKASYLLYIGPESEAKLYKCIDFVSTIDKYLTE